MTNLQLPEDEGSEMTEADYHRIEVVVETFDSKKLLKSWPVEMGTVKMNKSQIAFEQIIATKNGWSTAKDSMGNYTKFEVAYAWVGWQEAWSYLEDLTVQSGYTAGAGSWPPKEVDSQ